MAPLPAVIHAGCKEGVAGATLPDEPFRSELGHGRVGGNPHLHETAVLGGETGWPAAWWEGIDKFLIRVPRGDYLVEVSFIETEVAHRGLRVFDVLAEDRELFPRVDMASHAGDFQWLTLRGLATVLDGWLDLRFVAAAGARAPRASRIRIEPAPPRGGPPPGAVRLEAAPGPGRVVLRWSEPGGAKASGYTVLRSDAREGPFEPITREPWLLTRYEDTSAAGGGERFYRVAALDLQGAQGPPSEPASAAARPPVDLGLKVYDLRIPDEELRAISVMGSDATALGELRLHGAMEPVRVRFDSRPERWGRKKSFIIGPSEESARRILDRRVLHLSAESRDPTLLREAVSSAAARAVGLASPLVEPAAVFLNGRYLGVYLDIEALDARFRRRAGLDRVGLLAEDTRGDSFHDDWVPHGEERGEEGNIMHLTELVHELNRTGSGETLRLFEDRFYLDRFIDREALAIVRGEPDRSAALRYHLRDSRNGKWELFQDEHGSGCWGIRDHETGPSETVDAERARRSISMHAPGSEKGSVLRTRFFSEPRLVSRLFQRVEEMLARELAPEQLGAIVDGLFTRMHPAVLQDVDLGTRESAFVEGPARIKASHAARAAALVAAIAAERSRPAEPLAIEEALCRPLEGKPWLELRNGAAKPLRLSDWSIAVSARLPVDTGGSMGLPDRDLAAGERIRIDVPEALPSGGIIALLDRHATRRQVLFLGRQTRGVSYGLVPATEGSSGEPRWGHLAKPTPGLPNEGPALEPPSYDFRHGVVPHPEEGTTLWWKTRLAVDGEPRPEKVILERDEGGGFIARSSSELDEGAEPERLELAWDDKAFRYSIRLGPETAGRRMGYRFVAIAPGGIERAYPLPAPRLQYVLPVLPLVKINEVLPRPAQVPGSPGEFIEIYNGSDQKVDLEGYFLTDSKRNPTRWRIPGGNEIPPKGFAVFYADGRNRGNHASFKLSNSGEFLGLFGRMEEGNLPVDGIAFRGMKTGESWGANPDGSKSYRGWKDPTPGARNLPKIPKELLEKARAEAEGGSGKDGAEGPR